MEQSVVVSRSHIVRQGTFDTDPSKTLRSKSGAIKKGSIALPVIDDESAEESHLVHIGVSKELSRKRPNVSEKAAAVKAGSDSDQADLKQDKASRGNLKTQKDTAQSVIGKGGDAKKLSGPNIIPKEQQSSLEIHKSVRNNVTPTQENNVVKKTPSKHANERDQNDIKTSQEFRASKPNSRLKEPEKEIKSKTQEKKPTNTTDKSGDSGSVQPKSTKQEKRDNPDTTDSARNISENSGKGTGSNTKVSKPSDTTTKVIGRTEFVPSDKEPNRSVRNQNSLDETIGNKKARVKSAKCEKSKSKVIQSDKDNNRHTKSPVKRSRYTDDSDTSPERADVAVKVRYPEQITGKLESGVTTETLSTKRKRLTKASSVREDPDPTNTTNVKPSEQTPGNSESTSQDNKKGGTFQDKHNLVSVAGKPPQSTSLSTKRDKDDTAPTDLYKGQQEKSTNTRVVVRDRVSQKSLETLSAMEPSSEKIVESYDSVHAERQTLLEAEVTYRKRIKQLEEEMNQFLKKSEDLSTENKTLRSTVDQLEVENKRIADEESDNNVQSQQSSKTVVIDTQKDDLTRQIKILKKEKKTLDDQVYESYGKNKELTANNEKLGRENSILRERLEDIERTPSGKRKTSSLERSKELKDKLERSETELSEAKSTESALREEIAALKAAEEVHLKDTEKLQLDKKKLEFELEKFKEAAKQDAELLKDGSVTARDKMEMKSHVVSLQTDNQNLNEENMKLKAECLNHVRKIHELEKAVKASETDEKVAESEKSELETIKNENEKLKAELKKLTEESSNPGNPKQLQAANKALTDALSQKKMELDELMHALNGDRIEDEVQKVKAEKELILKKLEECEKKAELSEKAVQELERVKAEKESLQQKLEVSEKNSVESVKWQEEIQDLRSDKEKLQKQLEENTKQGSEESSAIVQDLQKQLNESKAHSVRMETSLEEVKIKNDELETEKNRVKKQLDTTSNEKQKLQTEMDEIQPSKDEMTRALDEEKAKLTLLSEKEWELDESRHKCEHLEKELARAKQQHGTEMKKLRDEKSKEEEKLRKEMENLQERKNDTIEKITKKMLSMESTKDLEIRKLKEQVETLLVDQETVAQAKILDKENKELRLELRTVYNKYSELVVDFEQKATTEARAFEMSMRVEQMSVKMKLMEKDEHEWRAKNEQFNDIEASNKRLTEENIALKKRLEDTDVSHRIKHLERRQTDSDTRVKQLEGWVGDLYVETDAESGSKGRNKNKGKGSKKPNPKTNIQGPAKLAAQNVKAHSLDDVEVMVDYNQATESSTPTLPSIYPSSTGQMTFRQTGYSQIYKARAQKTNKNRR